MKRTGFTFIELIISVTIFTIIMVTVYSAFTMGIKTWRRGHAERSLAKVRLTLLKIEKELKQTFFFSGIPFKGTLSEIEFPLAISDEEKERTYVITYSVDKDDSAGLKRIVRKETLFSKEMEQVEERIKESPPLMKSIKFEYVYKSNDPSEKFEWLESWNGEEQNKLPSGVRISLEMDDNSEIYNKVIFVQHGEFGIK